MQRACHVIPRGVEKSLTIQDYVATIPISPFNVETMLEKQIGAKEMLFPRMNTDGRGVCVKHVQGICSMGYRCPLRHISGEKAVVCQHWLRGLCARGDRCKYLHELDLSKMPMCRFFTNFMACYKKECPYRHVDPESRLKDCPFYDRGFCRHGPECKNRHHERVFCSKYLCGFCPDGRDCKFAHPTYNTSSADLSTRPNVFF